MTHKAKIHYAFVANVYWCIGIAVNLGAVAIMGAVASDNDWSAGFYIGGTLLILLPVMFTAFTMFAFWKDRNTHESYPYVFNITAAVLAMIVIGFAMPILANDVHSQTFRGSAFSLGVVLVLFIGMGAAQGYYVSHVKHR